MNGIFFQDISWRLRKSQNQEDAERFEGVNWEDALIIGTPLETTLKLD